MNTLPAFQFYPTDLSPDLDPLSMEERGMYLTLMRHLWPFGGAMPTEEAEALIQKPWLSTSAIFRRRFAECDGKIALEWMEKQREKVTRFRELQAEKGKKGGRPKRAKSASIKAEKPSLSFGKAKEKPGESPRGRAHGNGDGVILSEGKERARTDKRDPSVQAVIDHLVMRMQEHDTGATLDESVQQNRNMAKNLLRRLTKERPDLDPVESAKHLIDFATSDAFHRRNATKVSYLYRNVAKLRADYKSGGSTKPAPGSHDYQSEVIRIFNERSTKRERDREAAATADAEAGGL